MCKSSISKWTLTWSSFIVGCTFLPQILLASMEVWNTCVMSGVQNKLYCPDQPHLVPQPCTLGSVLKPQCLSGLYCRCIQPCCLLVLTCKLVCSFGLNLKLTLHLALVCLMITKLPPELDSHQSIPAWVCWTAPHQSWHCLTYVLSYQLVFPHGAALVTAWQPEQTLQSKTVVKTALNTSAFSISFATKSPPLLAAG